eukprot:SAG31_NODE_2217_length_6168_cov_10.730598_9_plen_177_part_00
MNLPLAHRALTGNREFSRARSTPAAVASALARRSVEFCRSRTAESARRFGWGQGTNYPQSAYLHRWALSLSLPPSLSLSLSLSLSGAIDGRTWSDTIESVILFHVDRAHAAVNEPLDVALAHRAVLDAWKVTLARLAIRGGGGRASRQENALLGGASLHRDALIDPEGISTHKPCP